MLEASQVNRQILNHSGQDVYRIVGSRFMGHPTREPTTLFAWTTITMLLVACCRICPRLRTDVRDLASPRPDLICLGCMALECSSDGTRSWVICHPAVRTEHDIRDVGIWRSV